MCLLMPVASTYRQQIKISVVKMNCTVVKPLETPPKIK